MSSLFTVFIRPSLADGFQCVTEYVPYRELYAVGTVTSVGVQPLSAGVSESVNSGCSRQVW